MDKETRVAYQTRMFREMLLNRLDVATVEHIIEMPNGVLDDIMEYLISQMTAQDIIKIPCYFESYLEHNKLYIISTINTRYVPTSPEYFQEYEGNFNKFVRIELVEEKGGITFCENIEQPDGTTIQVAKYKTPEYIERHLAYASRDLIERIMAYWLTNSTPQVAIGVVGMDYPILIDYFKNDIFRLYELMCNDEAAYDDIIWQRVMFIKSKYGKDEWDKAIIY